MVGELEGLFITVLANHRSACPLSEETIVALSSVDPDRVGEDDYYCLGDINDALSALPSHEFVEKSPGGLTLTLKYPQKLRAVLVDEGPWSPEQFRQEFETYYDTWHRAND